MKSGEWTAAMSNVQLSMHKCDYCSKLMLLLNPNPPCTIRVTSLEGLWCILRGRSYSTLSLYCCLLNPHSLLQFAVCPILTNYCCLLFAQYSLIIALCYLLNTASKYHIEQQKQYHQHDRNPLIVIAAFRREFVTADRTYLIRSINFHGTGWALFLCH